MQSWQIHKKYHRDLPLSDLIAKKQVTEACTAIKDHRKRFSKLEVLSIE